MKPSLSAQVILFMVFFCCTVTTSYAQDFTIKGQVTTNNGDNPLPGATVAISNTSKGATTNELGKYQIEGLAAGNYLLTITFLGFEKVERSISITDHVDLNIAMKPTSINLKEVTVSNANSITQTESMTGIDQQLRPINSAQDLLQLVPGLFIAQHAGGGKAEQIFIRGFDCDHGTDFNITIDGMPVNMVSHAHGQGYADFHFVIPETVDRLKVYKGPYTTKFGDFSTAGTGEYFTKNSLDQNEIKAEAGMFDSYRALGMFQLLDKKHLLSKNKENAYIAGEYVFTNSYFDQKQNFGRYNIFGKYSGMFGEKNQFVFSASTFSANWDASGQVPQRAIDAGTIDRFGSIDPTEGGQTQRSNVNMILTSSIGNAIIKNQLYYVNYYFDLYSNFTFFLNDSVRGDQINQKDQRSIYGYTGSYQKNLLIADKDLQMTLGIGTRNDLTNITLTHAEKRNILDTIVSGKVYQQNTNVFADFTINLTKQFTINAGARLDYFDFNYNDNLKDSLSGQKSILRASPKLNFYYNVNNELQFFLKSGIGFHSNDARSVVVNHTNNSLPKAFGGEVGTEFKLSEQIVVYAALWGLYLESELVYVGDEGTIETSNPTQRLGTDLSIRYQLTSKLFADVDLNYNHGRMVGLPGGENYIPLAPSLTSMGGLTFKQDKGINASLRYRFIDSRPANETNTVTAKGYALLDAVVAYKLAKLEMGVSVENVLNSEWNQAQFDTESRLFSEQDAVSELHFTPGTPLFIKGMVTYTF